MEALFELDKTKNVVLHKMNIMTVKEFSDILHRDRGSKGDSQGRLKKTASSELSFVYHLVDYKSPFNVYNEDEKWEQCKKNAGLPEKWKPDDVVTKAIEKYRALQKTKSLRLLEAVSNSLDKAQIYFDTIDFTKIDERTGKPIYSMKEYQTNIKGLADVITGFSKLEELVKLEAAEGGILRGNAKKGNREDPD